MRRGPWHLTYDSGIGRSKSIRSGTSGSYQPALNLCSMPSRIMWPLFTTLLMSARVHLILILGKQIVGPVQGEQHAHAGGEEPALTAANTTAYIGVGPGDLTTNVRVQLIGGHEDVLAGHAERPNRGVAPKGSITPHICISHGTQSRHADVIGQGDARADRGKDRRRVCPPPISPERFCCVQPARKSSWISPLLTSALATPAKTKLTTDNTTKLRFMILPFQ